MCVENWVTTRPETIPIVYLNRRYVPIASTTPDFLHPISRVDRDIVPYYQPTPPLLLTWVGFPYKISFMSFLGMLAKVKKTIEHIVSIISTTDEVVTSPKNIYSRLDSNKFEVLVKNKKNNPSIAMQLS